MAKSFLVQRVERRLAEIGKGPVEAATAVEGLERNYIRDLLDGKKRSFSQSKIALVAKALQWTQAELIADPRRRSEPAGHSVPLVGYVAAGAEAHFLSAGELGEVDAPAGSADSTVAVEIRGDSLGPLFDRWLVFYDDVKRPVTAELVGRLCVVGLEDGRILIKRVQRSKTKGLFHLISGHAEPPILDVAIEWAAKVKNLVPR